MSLYDKANDNYALALFAFREKMYNAAASRLYYAFYQACVKKHMESGRMPEDFMSSRERVTRTGGLKSNTDAPKWPHDILVRHGSLNALGLSVTQRQTIIHAKRCRVIGDYGDTNSIGYKEIHYLMEHAMDVFRQLRAPVTRRDNHDSV